MKSNLLTFMRRTKLLRRFYVARFDSTLYLLEVLDNHTLEGVAFAKTAK